ncbi:MAG: prepilin-type N-terminal cleavage/methylation domain-containing protein [Candidatus Pacebacteria bacterium]|nr:prepilin-type N-terminal cleavage/methylation domain-containing protein [Candidatus Paceibacterota bacterium]
MNQKGFNLIEVVVSIAIITIGLLAIISLFTTNIKGEIKSRNKLIAVYLANESIEIIRQQRDNSWFKGDGWMDDIPVGDVIVGLSDKDDIRVGWEVVLSNADRKKVYLSEDNDPTHSTFGSYIQLKSAALTSWKGTRFTRYLTITKNQETAPGVYTVAGCLQVEDCMEVVSHVSSNGVQMVEVTSYFYDGWF